MNTVGPRSGPYPGDGFAVTIPSGCAAQHTGPPLPPQGSLRDRLRRRPSAALDPGASAAPSDSIIGQARACPSQPRGTPVRRPYGKIKVSTVSGDCQSDREADRFVGQTTSGVQFIRKICAARENVVVGRWDVCRVWMVGVDGSGQIQSLRRNRTHSSADRPTVTNVDVQNPIGWPKPG
jgi:hypothetical protein